MIRTSNIYLHISICKIREVLLRNMYHMHISCTLYSVNLHIKVDIIVSVYCQERIDRTICNKSDGIHCPTHRFTASTF